MSFKFTSPDLSNPVNLSASSVQIRWNTSNTPPYPQVNLIFGGSTESGTSFTYNIAENVSTSGGSFTWDPANVSMALQRSKFELKSGKNYDFQASMHYVNSSEGATVTSSMFAVTGYPNISAASPSLQLHNGMIAMVMVLMLFLFGH